MLNFDFEFRTCEHVVAGVILVWNHTAHNFIMQLDGTWAQEKNIRYR